MVVEYSEVVHSRSLITTFRFPFGAHHLASDWIRVPKTVQFLENCVVVLGRGIHAKEKRCTTPMPLKRIQVDL